jgi:murein tripeptide amidase MpaA
MYRSVAQLDFVMTLLASFFPSLCTRLDLPEPSVEGRSVYGLRLRSGEGAERRGVLVVGGTHARELMNPDMLVELAVDLLVSYETGNDLVLGGRRWPAADVRLILETLDLYLVPCINPDGREHVIGVDDMWRKNRRDNPGTACDGVDLNRNLDLLWGVTEGQTSCQPCTDIYCGPAAFSEPETRNVRHLLDTYRIDCFVDVHSYSELVLYPWGHAPAQTTDPAARFTTLPSGTCQPLADSGYEEHMDPRDLQRFQTVAQRVVDGIAAVRGRVYTPQTGVTLYPTTGTHSDYAYSRHIADPTRRKVYGYTIETGPWAGNLPDSFHPPNPDPIKEEASSGVLALIQQCICSIELIGARVLGREDEVTGLRRVRDELLATTPAGRQWIALFERVQTPLLGVVMADEGLAGGAAELLAAAGSVLADDGNVLDPEVAARAAGFLRQLEGAGVSRSVRRDLRAVARALEEVAGQPVADIIQGLMARGPSR